MRTIGLLFSAADAPAALVVGGITVLERQARQLRRAGMDIILACDIEPLTPLPAGVEPVSVAALATLAGPGDRIVAIAPGLVIDDRAIDSVLAAGGAAILIARDGAASGVPGVGIERIDSATLAAGAMVLPGALVRQVAEGLGEWNLASTLLRAAAADPSVRRIDIAAVPLHVPALQRAVPLVWARPGDAAQATGATDVLVAAAQRDGRDWPGRFVVPWLEDRLVRALAPTRVTAEHVLMASLALGVAAAVAFGFGQLWAALLLALATGPVAETSRKLAHARVEVSTRYEVAALAGAVIGYCWIAGAAAHFAEAAGSMLPWAIAALIILPALGTAVQSAFFQRLAGFALTDAGPVERRIAVFAGCRDSFLWAWLPMAALGLWYEGFAVLAAYSIVTAGVAQWRFYVQLDSLWRGNGATADGQARAPGFRALPPGNASSK